MIRKLFWNWGSAADAAGAAPEACGERCVAGSGIRSPRDLEELREFLAADAGAPDFDPVFKERLRVELWDRFLARFETPPGSRSH